MAKKLNDIEHGMELQIIKSYRKEIDTETIIVWGDLRMVMSRIYESVCGRRHIHI